MMQCCWPLPATHGIPSSSEVTSDNQLQMPEDILYTSVYTAYGFPIGIRACFVNVKASLFFHIISAETSVTAHSGFAILYIYVPFVGFKHHV